MKKNVMKKYVKHFAMSLVTLGSTIAPMITSIGTLHAEVPEVTTAQKVVQILRKRPPRELEEMFRNLDENQRADLILEIRQALASEEEKIDALTAEIEKGHYDQKAALAVLGTGMAFVAGYYTAASLLHAAMGPVKPSGVPLLPASGTVYTRVEPAVPPEAPFVDDAKPSYFKPSLRIFRNISAYYKELIGGLFTQPRATAALHWRALALHGTAFGAAAAAIATQVVLANLPDEGSGKALNEMLSDKLDALVVAHRLRQTLSALAVSVDAEEAHHILIRSI
ncbi:MAG: hypothetical protein C5B49_09375 [Bdellovibrio sp.]|nr:MAG: hypothetical protein C5B49_09375 [Bdellovibrio sp.]